MRNANATEANATPKLYPNPVQFAWHQAWHGWPKHLAGVMDYDCCINFICWRRFPPSAFNIWLFSFPLRVLQKSVAYICAPGSCCSLHTARGTWVILALKKKLLAIVEDVPSEIKKKQTSSLYQTGVWNLNLYKGTLYSCRKPLELRFSNEFMHVYFLKFFLWT